MQSLQNYLLWIYKKIGIQNEVRNKQINEGEVWWCFLGENVGDEENGKGDFFRRPVLVFKKFNNNICWALPLSTSLKDNKYYVTINLNSEKRSALISQLRILDSKRFDIKMGQINKTDFELVVEGVLKVINQINYRNYGSRVEDKLD